MERVSDNKHFLAVMCHSSDSQTMMSLDNWGCVYTAQPFKKTRLISDTFPIHFPLLAPVSHIVIFKEFKTMKI